MKKSMEHGPGWAKRQIAWLFTWGLPTVCLVCGLLISLPSRIIAWIFALVWLGVTLLIKATRTGLLGSIYLGFFFLLMAVIVALYGFDIVWQGGDGWAALSVAIFLGAAVLGWPTKESLWREVLVEVVPRCGSEISVSPLKSLTSLGGCMCLMSCKIHSRSGRCLAFT